MFKKVGIMAKQQTAGIAETLNLIIDYLLALNVQIIVEQETRNVILNYDVTGIKSVSQNELGQHCDLLIVIGGDGSLLNASHTAAQQNLPIIGVNRGTLGFLTDILPHKINKLSEILAGKFIEEQRFFLKNSVYSKQQLVGEDLALNDIVILSGKVGRMIQFTLYNNDNLVCSYRADGLIISTPTGSTAHALSGGGPIVHPSLDVLAIVPMFSHNLSSRSIVINANNTLKLIATHDGAEGLKAICDGQNEITIPENGEIIIKKAPNMLRLIHPLDYDYFEALRMKLNWER